MRKIATWKGRRWERLYDGTWIDLATGRVDPLAEDMTISNFYNFRVVSSGSGKAFVEVPVAMAHEEDDLKWAVRYQGTIEPEEGEEWKGARPKKVLDYRGKSVILVPIEVWDRMDERIGSIGIWHPEIR